MSSSLNSNLPVQTMASLTTTTEHPNSRQGASSSFTGARSRSQHEMATSHKNRGGKGARGRFRQGPASIRNDAHVERDANTDGPESQMIINSGPGAILNRRQRNKIGGGFRSKQRQHVDQLLDGVTTMTGLDSDAADNSSLTGTSNNRYAMSGRKINLSHLVKFERKQRPNRYQKSNNNNASYTRANVDSFRDPGTIHKFSKQQFLQANCQFVVLDGHDYTIHKADPDWPVDWNCIEEVRFKQCASNETTCPICLEPPIAAKITRCGHIYCWTCILHYLSLSDDKYRQCPICFEHVYRNDLRSVVSHSFINFSVDEEIVMRLMIRKRGCVEFEPYMTENSNHEHSNTSSEDLYCSQANLVIVDPHTVVTKIAQREKDALLKKLELDKDEPEVCFIQQALSYLDKRVEKLHFKASNESNTTNRVLENAKSERRISPSSNVESTKNYLFYQCSDGQHIYLNPFSTKILCHEFGSLENCPPKIQAKILQMDWISMSEAWRKRFRYLEHLPLTCEFRLIEIDFDQSKLISRETYSLFEEQIKKRQRERQRRLKEELKRDKIIQVEQNRRIYGIQPSLKINLDNMDQFPSVSDERYLGLTQQRHLPRSNDELSSEDENHDSLHNTSTNSSQEPVEPAADFPICGSSNDATAEVALSFKDIQLQEAALEAKSAERSVKSASSWQPKRSGSSSTQSSFAQLLVNAKISKKEWTRNTTHASESNVASSSFGQRPLLNSDSDCGSEEFRVAPGEFTLSDFMDMNVVTAAGKKRPKVKNLQKKI